MNAEQDWRKTLEAKAHGLRKDWYHAQWCWSVAHNGTLILASVLSVFAGLFVQADFQFFNLPSKSLTTLMTFTAAALSAVAASGGFGRKWRAARMSRARLDGLLLELATPNADLVSIKNQLKQLILGHDEHVLGIATAPSADEAAAQSTDAT